MFKWMPLVALGVVLVGCSGGSQTPEAGTKEPEKPATPSATKTLKVALLTPGPVSDAGWSALAYEGLQAIKTDLGAEVNNTEAKDAQIEESMRSYAQQGYNLVFGHGFEYNEPGVKISKEFPNTFFVSSSGGGTSPNAGAFRFGLEEAFYLAGYTAGKLSKSGTVAMIGGPDVPSIRSTFKGFKAGAEAAKPGIKVIETFTGKNDDIAAAKLATTTAIGQGADMVIHQANAGAQGVFDACKEKNVLAFGANLNQNDNASGAVLASAVISAKPAFVALAKEVQAGTYKGQVKLVTMKDGAIGYVWNDKLKSKVTPELQKEIEDLTAKIKSGELKVPMDTF